MPRTMPMQNAPLGKELADKFVSLHLWISQLIVFV
jgi:hypothetical protein